MKSHNPAKVTHNVGKKLWVKSQKIQVLILALPLTCLLTSDKKADILDQESVE